MIEQSATATFITFYSFKGGVGRSMALINTAGRLAGRGFRVLVVDLDLEAPGLSYLSSHSNDSIDAAIPLDGDRMGFVDLLTDAKLRGEKSDLFSLSIDSLTKRYTRRYDIPDGLRKTPDGTLSIMPAGKFDGHYAERFDALDLRGLYEQGIGEPLIRAFKKKFAEADLFDYILVDSRTGFSDEAGICTRDLADYLMIFSGLNRQNVEGTSEFLRALRIANQEPEARFQIILSPVPNGEDALVDERERVARATFESAWGARVRITSQIPYHPQLALTEELGIFRRHRGSLFEAYRTIERRMLTALGHDPKRLMAGVRDALKKEQYRTALHDLKHLVRLDQGAIALSQLATTLRSIDRPSSRTKLELEGSAERATIDRMVSTEAGRLVLEFIVDNLPIDGGIWRFEEFVRDLKTCSVDLADRLYRRAVSPERVGADILGDYAVFLETQRDDVTMAEKIYRRAIEMDTEDARNLANFADFLRFRRKDVNEAEKYYKLAIDAHPTKADSLYEYAGFLVAERGDLDLAELYFKRAIEVDPNNADALSAYASFLEQRRDDIDGADQHYKRALSINPSSAEILTDYALFLEIRRHSYAESANYYKLAIEADPRDADHLGYYADLLQNKLRDYESADGYYLRAITESPDSPLWLCQYASFLANYKGKLDEAESLYRRALNLAPADATIRSSYAAFLSEWREDPDRAEEEFRKAIEIEPNSSEILSRFAAFLHFFRRNDDAADALHRRAVDAGPADVFSLRSYATFLANRNDLERAEVLFRRAVESGPHDSDALYAYASFLATNSPQLEAADSLFDRALKSDPLDPVILENYADFLWTQKNDTDRAELLFQRAIEVDPNAEIALENYAVFLADVRNDRAAAEAMFRRAIDASSNSAWVLNRYAWFLANKSGDDALAELYFQRALDAEPTNSLILSNHGQSLVAVGRFADAHRALIRAFENSRGIEAANFAELLFSLWLTSTLAGQPADRWEAGFKYMITAGFSRHKWSFDRMLLQARSRLSFEEMEYVAALASAFLDSASVSALENFERWKHLDQSLAKSVIDPWLALPKGP